MEVNVDHGGARLSVQSSLHREFPDLRLEPDTEIRVEGRTSSQLLARSKSLADLGDMSPSAVV